MTRLTAVPRPIRMGVALTGVASALALAGCASPAAPAGATATPTAGGLTSAAPSTGTAAATTYRNGTYTGTGSYQTPETVEEVSVVVTLADDVITSVEVKGDPKARESQQYQSQFIGGISEIVVGKDIDEISVSRVAGSSLTSGGFTKAIAEIKTEAAA